MYPKRRVSPFPHRVRAYPQCNLTRPCLCHVFDLRQNLNPHTRILTVRGGEDGETMSPRNVQLVVPERSSIMNRKSSRYLGNICGIATVVPILLLAASNVVAVPAETGNVADTGITGSQPAPRMLLAAQNNPPATKAPTPTPTPTVGGQSQGGGAGSSWPPPCPPGRCYPDGSLVLPIPSQGSSGARGKPAHNSGDRPSLGSSMYDTNK
jgi:hypothetical protein